MHRASTNATQYTDPSVSFKIKQCRYKQHLQSQNYSKVEGMNINEITSNQLVLGPKAAYKDHVNQWMIHSGESIPTAAQSSNDSEIYQNLSLSVTVFVQLYVTNKNKGDTAKKPQLELVQHKNRLHLENVQRQYLQDFKVEGDGHDYNTNEGNMKDIVASIIILYAFYLSSIHSFAKISAVLMILSHPLCALDAIEVNEKHPLGLPNITHSIAVGYDAVNDSILLLGGYTTYSYDRQFLSFNGSIFDYEPSYLPDYPLFGLGQFYSQLHNPFYNTLFMISNGGTSFTTMDIASRQVNPLSSFWITLNVVIPTGTVQGVGDYACLASMTTIDLNEYLFVVGGWDSVYFDRLKSLYILDVTRARDYAETEWLLFAPDMHVSLRSLACIVHNNTLYAIGGETNPGVALGIIQTLDVSDLTNIMNVNWVYMIEQLSFPVFGCRAVVYESYIFVVGGRDENMTFPINIQIINTITKSVSIYDGALAYGVYSPAVVIANNILYVIGGVIYTSYGIGITKYQYMTVGITSNPTAVPTSSPTKLTYNPTVTTINPTHDPTIDPTNEPTVDPTSDPTTEPTIDPTADPTTDPIADPTTDPTKEPSAAPTAPSLSPSNAPSVSPTCAPTQSPSLSPSNAPSVSPSYAPTQSPTFSPSIAPSLAPTRFPTATDPYDAYIDIIFGLKYLTDLNIYTMTDNAIEVITDIERIIERGFIIQEPIATVAYKGLWCKIELVNGYKIEDIDISLDDEFSWMEILELESTIECDTLDCEIIRGKFDNDTLTTFVTDELRAYFNGNSTELEFVIMKISGVNSKVDVDVDPELEFEQQIEALNNLYQAMAASFAALCFIVGLLAFVDAKQCRINDYFKISAILTMFLQSIDMMSDCFFAAQIYVYTLYVYDVYQRKYSILFSLSILFIVLPAVTALFQLYFYAKKHWLKDDRIRPWISKYATLLLLLSVMTGSSFAAVALLNSFMFKLEILDMGLSQTQLKQFNTKRLYSIVLLENLPQLVLQFYFLMTHESEVNAFAIAISSIVFSMISILVSVLSMMMQKNIHFTQSYMVISMDITGNDVKECQTMCSKLQKGISRLMKVYVKNTEIIKPTPISKGLHFKMYIYVNDGTMDYLQRLKVARDNGELAAVVKEGWGLSSLPTISDIQSEMMESKERQKTVEMMEAQMSSDKSGSEITDAKP